MLFTRIEPSVRCGVQSLTLSMQALPLIWSSPELRLPGAEWIIWKRLLIRVCQQQVSQLCTMHSGLERAGSEAANQSKAVSEPAVLLLRAAMRR